MSPTCDDVTKHARQRIGCPKGRSRAVLIAPKKPIPVLRRAYGRWKRRPATTGRGGRPDGDYLRRVAGDLSHDHARRAVIQYAFEESTGGLYNQAIRRLSPIRIVDGGADHKAARSGNLTGFRLSRRCGSVPADTGLTAAESGGQLSLYGKDPIVPSRFKFGGIAGVRLATRSTALAALWNHANKSCDAANGAKWATDESNRPRWSA
jgi:hypothetical protein